MSVYVSKTSVFIWLIPCPTPCSRRVYLLEVSDPLAAGHLYLFQVVNYQFIVIKVGLIHVINRVVSSRCI